jgi:hypothetical protein
VEYPDGSNADLYASPADWISPKDDGTYLTDPSAADGRKVIVLDTDHLGTQQIASSGYAWIWKSFLRGHNLLFMDQYDGAGTGVGANSSISPNDPRWVSFRKNLGYAKRYADKVDLGSMVPSGGLASSGYCLARAAAGGEYLVYLPSTSSVTMNLSATPGSLSVEWFNPADGTTTSGGTIAGGGASVALTSPFGGNAVLYLHQAASARPAPPTNLRAN